jgi:hypothetical protein
MNLVFNSVSEVWARTFLQYIDSSIQAGKAYMLHEKDNIAVMAVHMADSAVEAFKARMALFSGSGTGQPTPQTANETEASFSDKLSQHIKDAKPQNVVAVIDQGMARFNQQADRFVPASKPKPPRM